MCKVGVLIGGDSAEAEVSRSSGREIAKSLSGAFQSVNLFELSEYKGWDSLVAAFRATDVDVVFPALHGGPGEDGTLQQVLDDAGIPYVGSGSQASAMGLDKEEAKKAFRQNGLPVAKDAVVSEDELSPAKVKSVLEMLGGSVVVKPIAQGSAIGISFCKSAAELEESLRAAFKYGPKALIEERIIGKEITAGLLERNGLEVFPLIEIRTPPGTWCDFEHRYQPGLSEHVIPAPLSVETGRRVSEIARGAFRALGCRDLARAEFVVPEKGEPVILEVNTMPGFTPTSLYPDGAKAAGISFGELCAHLIRRAHSRANS